jgi:hypothetical protein
MIAQSTIDELHAQEFRWNSRSGRESMSIGLVGNELVRHIVTSEDAENAAKYFAKLLAWLREHADIQPVSPQIAETWIARGFQGDIIGRSYLDTLLIAKERGAILLSDDLWLRRLAKNSFDIDGICTERLLHHEHDAGRITLDTYNNAVVTMIASGYRALPVTARILASAAQRNQWQPGEALKRVLNVLSGPSTEAESAMRVAAEFIRDIWLYELTSHQRSALLFSILEAVVAGRDTFLVFSRLRVHLQSLLALLPLAQYEITSVMARWQQISIVNVVR